MFLFSDEPETADTKWFKPKFETENDSHVDTRPTSPAKNATSTTYSDHPRNLPLSDDLRSSIAQDSPGETQPTFFECSTPELFLSSSMTSSTTQAISGVPFPRKLPEITNKTDDVIDHRSVAIESLKHVLEGIKYFDR